MKIINLIKIFCLSIVAAVFVAIAFNTSFEKESDKLEITFLDVGQGDCAYIKTPDNYRIMIDTGDEGTYDNYIKAFLGSRKIPYLDAAVVTHFDSDHCRGLYEMLGEKRVDTVYVPFSF